MGTPLDRKYAPCYNEGSQRKIRGSAMRRWLRKWWILGIAAVFLVGGSLWAGHHFSRGASFRYSNLVDETSQQQARSLLEQANVPTEDADLFFQLVDAFYDVPYEGIPQSGWEKAFTGTFAYDDDAAIEHYSKSDNRVVCRTAAFLLTRYGIPFGETDLPPAEMKDQCAAYFTDRSEQLRYNRLFASLPAGTAETSEQVWDTLKAYWREAAVTFREGTAQLINVYGLTGDEIQNFHAAVALYGEDSVWLLEKYDPIYPYQLSHFEQEQDMIAYLQHRVDAVDCAVITRGGVCLWKK